MALGHLPIPALTNPSVILPWKQARYQTLQKSFQGNSGTPAENILDFANNPVDVTGKTGVAVKICKISNRSRTQGHLKLSPKPLSCVFTVFRQCRRCSVAHGAGRGHQPFPREGGSQKLLWEQKD